MTSVPSFAAPVNWLREGIAFTPDVTISPLLTQSPCRLCLPFPCLLPRVCLRCEVRLSMSLHVFQYRTDVIGHCPCCAASRCVWRRNWLQTLLWPLILLAQGLAGALVAWMLVCTLLWFG